MSYSRKSSDSDSEGPITGSAFSDDSPESERDPYERFAELMVVVEELCPEWPERDTFKDSDIYLL